MRSWMAVFIVGGLFGSASLAEGPNPQLSLVCRGKASRDETSHATLLGPPQREQRVDYEDDVYIQVGSDGGRAKLPKQLQSKHKEDQDGWFPLVGVSMAPNEVNGQIRLHSMYKPKFHLDRVTGLLTINGILGDFAGDCVKIDPETPARKF